MFGNLGKEFEAVRVGGGSGKSDEWLQLKANMFGTRIEKVKNLEVSSVGAAIIAAKGLGIYDYEEAFKRMVCIEKVMEPNKEIQKRYQERYQEWKSL